MWEGGGSIKSVQNTVELWTKESDNNPKRTQGECERVIIFRRPNIMVKSAFNNTREFNGV